MSVPDAPVEDDALMDINDSDIAKMRRLARSKARRLVRWRDDWSIVADDMEQDGWEQYIISISQGRSEYAWLDARRRMTKAFLRWRYGRDIESFRDRDESRIPLRDLDARPLANLDPSVEDLVLGCEIIKSLESEFERVKPGRKDKAIELLHCMILNGSPDLRGTTYATDNGLDRTKNGKRRQRIRKFVTDLLQ